MNECPNDNEVMVTFELDGIEIDWCVECCGTWLDSGELESIAELAGADYKKLHTAIGNAKTIKKSKRRCPRCNRMLEEFSIQSNTESVILDRCPAGHGLFFDTGEMQQVIATFETGDTGAVAEYFSKLFAHERKGKVE